MTKRDATPPTKTRKILLADLRSCLGVDRDGPVFDELYHRGIVADGAMGIEDVPDRDLLRGLKELQQEGGEAARC